jgi:hypothetical protein
MILKWRENPGPSCPGGGFIEYEVEVETPRVGLGEEMYRVWVKERSEDSGETDSMLLDEVDLQRMIGALQNAQMFIAEHKAKKTKS